MTLTAIIQIGQSSSSLVILEPDRSTRAHFNLIWGYGGGRSPESRANVLLLQNGYRRVGPWSETAEGQTAAVEAGGETTNCSCWRRLDGADWVIRERDYRCSDHPEADARKSEPILPF